MIYSRISFRTAFGGVVFQCEVKCCNMWLSYPKFFFILHKDIILLSSLVMYNACMHNFPKLRDKIRNGKPGFEVE